MPKSAKTYEDEFRAVVAKQRGYYGYKSLKKLAAAIGMAERTLSHKIKYPDYFTTGEHRRLCMVLHFSAEERDLLNHTGRIKLC